MRILVVAATNREVAPLAACLVLVSEDGRLSAAIYGGHNVDVLVTGVGMVATAAWCSQTLTRQRYDLALNVGVCGSFDPGLAPGIVAHVVSDRLAEQGAEDAESFVTVQELGLLGEEEFPFAGGQLVNPAQR